VSPVTLDVIAEVGIAETGSEKVGRAEVGIAEVGAAEDGAVEVLLLSAWLACRNWTNTPARIVRLVTTIHNED
jgi:hypothetical protein